MDIILPKINLRPYQRIPYDKDKEPAKPESGGEPCPQA